MFSWSVRALTNNVIRTVPLISRATTRFPVQVASFSLTSSHLASPPRKTRRNEKERRLHRQETIEEQRRKEPPPVPEPEIPYTSDDLIPGPGMLRRIVSDLERAGNKMVLPNDEEQLAQLASGLRYLCNIGVRPEFIISACSTRPQLVTLLTKYGQDSIATMEVLTEMCAFHYEDAVRMLASYGAELRSVGAEGMQKRLDVVNATGVEPGRKLGSVVRICPAILFGCEPTVMAQIAENLGGFFSRKEIAGVVARAPQVLLKNIDDLEEKYEYIFYQMCIEGESFKKCAGWVDLQLDEIIMRHKFLKNCGRYTTPDKKNPQLKAENPELYRILDTTDEQFATQVGGVTLEEWMVFRAFEEKALANVDKARPYERIKPSQRKLYERRKKESKELGEHVFDVSAHSE